jgi:hypothetical protein
MGRGGTVAADVAHPAGLKNMTLKMRPTRTRGNEKRGIFWILSFFYIFMVYFVL